MNFPDYSPDFPRIRSEPPPVHVKRKKTETEIESQEEKTTFLAEQRFNESDIEEPPSKQRKVVEKGQKGKEKIDKNVKTALTESERALLNQRSQVFNFLFNTFIFEEAHSQNPIYLNIDDPDIYNLFFKILGGTDTLDELKALDEQQKETTGIKLLDLANKWGIKKLKKNIINWFEIKLLVLDKPKNEDIEKIVDWHTFARSRELISLQESCEDFLIRSFLVAGDDKEKQLLIEKLKKIQLMRLDVSDYSDKKKYRHSDDLATAYLKKVVYLISELSLTELDLGLCKWLTDDSLALLKDLPLKKLTISGGRITDNGLMHLKNMPLEELSWIGNNFTDRGLIHFQGFKNLRVLNFCDSGSITGSGLIHLKDLPLQTLILYACDELGHECVTNLKHLTNLQKLSLSIRGEQGLLAPLADLPKLRILHLGMNRDVDRLTHLKRLSLEELQLYYGDYDIKSRDLENLEGLPLRKLFLTSPWGIKDDAVIHLKKLHFLEELKISDTADWVGNGQLTNAGIAHLSDLSSLKKLTLKAENLTGDCLIHLQNLFRLEKLYYSVRTIRDGDLGNLEGLPLRKLSLISNQGSIADAALTHLTKLHFLEELEIYDLSEASESLLTDASVAHLSHLSQLKKLTLGGRNLTRACLIHLQNLPHLDLETVTFHTKDKDLEERFPYLRGW